VEDLSESHDLCIGGDCFEMLQRTETVIYVVPYVKVPLPFFHFKFKKGECFINYKLL
jgi:hypothetical protein